MVIPLDSIQTVTSSDSAKWIGMHWRAYESTDTTRAVAFRHDVVLDSIPQRAFIKITARDRYVLWVNGVWAADGPAISPADLALVDTIDVAGMLCEGNNSLAFVVYSNKSEPMLFADGLIHTAINEVRILSDSTWHVRRADWLGPLSAQDDASVVYSAPAEPPDWRMLAPRHGWQPAQALRSNHGADIPALADRPIGRLYEEDVVAQLAWLGRGPRTIHARGGAVVDWFNQSAVEGDGVYRLKATPGHYELTWDNVLTFDLGRACFCRPCLSVHTEADGGVMVIYYHATLSERPLAGTSLTAKGTQTCDVIELGKGQTDWTRQEPRGARYVTIHYGGTIACEIDTRFSRIRYPFASKSSFTSGDALLEKTWHTAAETLDAATADVYGHSTIEDSRLWPSDLLASGRAAFYSFGETALWRRCLLHIPCGLGILDANNPLDIVDTLVQRMYWARSCWDYQMLSGDRTLLPEVAQSVSELLDDCAEYMTEEDLFAPSRTSRELDALSDEPYSLELNALLYMTAKSVQRIAQAVSDDGMEQLAMQFVDALGVEAARFYDIQQRRYLLTLPRNREAASRRDANDNRWLIPNAMICLAGLGPNAQRKAVASSIAEVCVPPMGRENRVSPVHVSDIGRVLSDYGYADSALRFFQTVYAEKLYGGAVTFGANLGGTVSGDACAAAASINTYLAEDVIGLRPVVAGWRRILLRPSFLVKELTYAFHSPAGRIAIQIEGARIIASHPEGVQLECAGKNFAGTGEPQVVFELNK